MVNLPLTECEGTEFAPPFSSILNDFTAFVNKGGCSMNIIMEAVLFAVIYTALRAIAKKLFGF